MLAHIVALSPREETNFKYRIFLMGVIAAVVSSICQKRGRENRPDGDWTGRGRKRAILAAWRECRMVRISAFCFRPAAAGGGLCGQLAGARQPEGGMKDKRSAGFCTGEGSNQAENAARSPVFPGFPIFGEFLCGKKFPSLRQEENFFQQRNFILTAQKSSSGPGNAR